MSRTYLFKHDVSRSLSFQEELPISIYTLSHHHLFRASKETLHAKKKAAVLLDEMNYYKKKYNISIKFNKHVSPPCGAQVIANAISGFVIFSSLKLTNGALIT